MARKRNPNACANCGGTELVDAVDNDGQPYKGCARCIVSVDVTTTVRRDLQTARARRLSLDPRNPSETRALLLLQRVLDAANNAPRDPIDCSGRVPAELLADIVVHLVDHAPNLL